MAAEEVAVEVVEETISFFANKGVQFTGVAIMAGALGFAVGWQFANKRLAAKYDEVVREELEASKDFLEQRAAKLDKVDEFQDPVEMLRAMIERGYEPNSEEAALIASASDKEVMKAVADAGTTDYTAMYVADDTEVPLEAKGLIEVSETAVVTTRAVFEEIPTEDQEAWTAVNEMLKRNGQPHVISREEFMENDEEFEHVTISWYDEDEVLADERDQIVDDIEGVVGQDNMHRFGWLSEDPKIVFIKNEDSNTMFEVVYSEGSYAKEVLGFTHSDDTFERRKKIRRSDLE